MTIKYKYAQKIEKLKLEASCPPADVSSDEREAYRFTNKDISDSGNFIPQAITNPARINSTQDIDNKCKLISGLSMYSTKEFAMRRYSSWPRQTKKKLGFTHLAKGTVGGQEGRTTRVEKSGHFTLFELESCDLTKKFLILDTLA